jgi:anti-sigma regulatory factor (Ser/Thr protein kinase)
VAARAVSSAGRSPTAAGSSPQTVLLARTFGRDDITDVRHEVSTRLAAVGLSGDPLQGFVLAVNEVITNVVLHAGGGGRLVLRLSGGSVTCAVADSGPGIPERFRSAPTVPAAFEVGGRGVWLAYQLCDEVSMDTSAAGTTVTLRLRLPVRDASSNLVDGAATPS